MKVLKAFDRYVAGDTMKPEDVEDQRQRGNLDDLLANGFVEGVQEDESLTLAELRQMAKERGIRGYSRMKRETLEARLAAD